jgi:hypothetical protein
VAIVIYKITNLINHKIYNRFSKVMVIDILSGKVFNSISEASKYFNISHNMVRDRIYNRVKNDKFKNEFILKIYNN